MREPTHVIHTGGPHRAQSRQRRAEGGSEGITEKVQHTTLLSLQGRQPKIEDGAVEVRAETKHLGD